MATASIFKLGVRQAIQKQSIGSIDLQYLTNLSGIQPKFIAKQFANFFSHFKESWIMCL
jgi:hypothetical protein